MISSEVAVEESPLQKSRCPHLERPRILQVAQQLLHGRRAAQLGEIKVGETSASEKNGGHGDFMGISWQKMWLNVLNGDVHGFHW